MEGKEKGARTDRNTVELHRREFVVGATASAVLLGSGITAGCGDDEDNTGGPAKVPPANVGARVVDLYDPLSVDMSGKVDEARARAMLHAGLRKLTGEQDLGRIWRSLIPDFHAGTCIGLKVNAAFYRAANSPALIKALVQTLTTDLGAAADKIIVWDISDILVRGAGITTAATGATVMGTTMSPSAPGYGTDEISVAGKKIRLARLFTDLTDVTLNLAILKDHNIAGMTGALKNVYGVFNNPGDFHSDLVTALPQIYALPQIKSRMRLCITEAFIAVSEGGPLAPASHSPGRLMMAQDPVALDTHALTLLNSIRKTPLPPAKLAWLQGAEKLGLGKNKPELVKVTM